MVLGGGGLRGCIILAERWDVLFSVEQSGLFECTMEDTTLAVFLTSSLERSLSGVDRLSCFFSSRG